MGGLQIPEAGWPKTGELDIMENVNGEHALVSTVHTGPGIRVNAPGITHNGDCNADGCGFYNYSVPSGPAFNAQGGGKYILDKRSDKLSVFFVPRAVVNARGSKSDV